MKKQIIWTLIILLSISALLILADYGALPWISQKESPPASVAVEAESAAQPQAGSNPSSPQQITLVPVAPAPTESSLRIHLTDNGALPAQQGKWNFGLIIEDQEGRRSGVDVIEQVVHQEILNSNVERKTDQINSGKARETVVVEIKPALSTTYSLEIGANQASSYRLSISGVSPELNSITEIVTGYVPTDTVIRYRINLENIRPMPVAGNMRGLSTASDTNMRFVGMPEEHVRQPTDPSLLGIAEAVQAEPCGYFEDRLKGVPHESLTRNDGSFLSLWSNTEVSGCEIIFVTNEKLIAGHKIPDFAATDGTELYRIGWRINNSMAADGPGTSVYGIQNDSLLCLISYDQSSYLDESSGEIIQSESINMQVQCSNK